MEVKIHAYRGNTTPLYNFINLHINLYEHTETIRPPLDCINYWLSEVVYEHSTTVDNIVPRGFFNGNPNNYIVLQLSQEGIGLGNHSPISARVDRIVQAVPADKIVVLVNCPQQGEYFRKFYPNITNIIEFNFLELLTRSYMPARPLDTDTENARRFLYLNRRNYSHRTLLFGKLWQEPDFVKNSYTSFNPGTYWDTDTRTSENHSNPEFNVHVNGIVRDLSHIDPGVAEWFKLQKNFPQLPERYSKQNPYDYDFFSQGLAQAHADTDISVVVESNAYRIEQGFFSTEKIYRPIASGQAFIAFAQPSYYENLRRLGYETYESIFNEKHDSIANDFERCASVARTVQRLARLESGEFAALMERTRRIRKHNHRVFLQRTSLASVALNFTGPLEPLRPLLRYSIF